MSAQSIWLVVRFPSHRYRADRNISFAEDEISIVKGCLISISVVGFGLATILFGVSSMFWLTMLALILVGMFDGFSSIIRNTVRQILTPDAMRGRMMSITQIFIRAAHSLEKWNLAWWRRSWGCHWQLYRVGWVVCWLLHPGEKIPSFGITPEMKQPGIIFAAECPASI